MNAPGAAREDRALAASAAACAALVFVVVAASAWLRLAGGACAGAGCPEGFTLADAVRLSHRVAAMGVTVLALVIAALAWKAPARPARRVASVVLIVLVAALAIVGRRSAGGAPPAVMLANLLGGLALLGLAVGLAAAPRAPRGRASPAFVAAAALLAAAIATGGVLAIAPPADPASLALVHRGVSVAALLGWGLLAASTQAASGARAAARLATLLLAAQALLAFAAPGWELARWAHNLLTAAALCAAVAAATTARAALPGAPPASGRVAAGP